MLIFEYICIKHFGRRMLFTHKTERREIYWISARAAPIYSQSITPPPLKIRKCQKILLASSLFHRRKAFFPQECDITVLTKVASFQAFIRADIERFLLIYLNLEIDQKKLGAGIACSKILLHRFAFPIQTWPGRQHDFTKDYWNWKYWYRYWKYMQ